MTVEQLVAELEAVRDKVPPDTEVVMQHAEGDDDGSVWFVDSSVLFVQVARKGRREKGPVVVRLVP